MSVNTIENAFWQAISKEEATSAFRDDMSKFLDGFDITDKERTLILDWDVPQLLSHGVNPPLLMAAFTLVHGRTSRPQYVKKAGGVWPAYVLSKGGQAGNSPAGNV